MEKADYLVPNEQWLLDQFNDIPFGIMRPSEMEVTLAYFIIYHNDRDIEESVEYLAGKYRISESKAKRFKIEFANRYRQKDKEGKEVPAIIARLFEKDQAPFEYNKANKMVSFMVKDPWELKTIRQDLEDKRIVFSGDFNGKLIKLTRENFVQYINLHSADMEKQKKLKHLINRKMTDEQKKESAFWQALDAEKKIKALLEKAPPMLAGIISAGVKVVGPL